MSVGDFYIGYQPDAPKPLAQFRARVGIVFLIVFVSGMALFAFGQRKQPEGLFEFGIQREWEGVLYETPVPMLVIEDGSESAAVLVGLFKFGIPEVAKGHHGERVSFAGTLIEAGGFRMIEMNDPDSFEARGEAGSTPGRIDGGRVELEGELVDTKCFLGVMRPGAGKVHRACAVRCLSGGVPPGLLVRRSDGSGALFYLAGPEGGALDFDVQWAARRTRVSGQLYITEGVLTVFTDSLELSYGPEGGE